MGKGKGTETYTRFDLAEQWLGRPAVHKIGPSGSPNHRGSALAVRYRVDPAAGQAAMGEHLRASLQDYHFGEIPDYHGYHLEIELSALATAKAAGHGEIVAMVRRLLAARVAYEGLLEDADGRLCAPGTRRGGPWDDGADEARSWLENGRSAGHAKKLAGAVERQSDLMGAAMARDAVLRGLIDRIPNDLAHLPRLRSPLVIQRYEHGFVAWHPDLDCYGGPWWLVAVDNRKPRAGRLVASISWKDVTRAWKQKDAQGLRGYDMGGGPWTRAGRPFPAVDLGAAVEEIAVGGAVERPKPPPPPERPEPKPPEPPDPVKPKPRPPAPVIGGPFLPPEGMHVLLPLPGGQKVVVNLLPGEDEEAGTWEKIRWHKK